MEVKSGYKQTEVGVIPNEWEVKALGHLIKLQAGYSFRSENFSDVGTPVIRISDIQDGIVDVDSAICHPPFKIDDDFVVKTGDLLVAMSGATTGKVGVFRSPKPAYQNQRVGRFVVRNENLTSQLFVGQLVRSSRFGSRLGVLLEQGAQPNVSGIQIESLLFPIPSQLSEQRAIATALSDVDGLLGGLDRLIAKKRDLKQAAMQQLLTGKTRLPGFHGEWGRLNMADDSTLKARIGWQGLTTAEYLCGGDYYLVTGTDFSDGRIDWSGCFFVAAERFTQDRNIQLRPKDILITKDGTIGKVAFIDRLPGPATLNSGVFVIRPKDKAYDPQFFYYVLTSRIFDEFMNKLQAGSTISHLYQKDFVSFSFLAPTTLPEQTAIASVLSEVDAELAMLEQRREKTSDLKQGMMQALLTGRVRLPIDDTVGAKA